VVADKGYHAASTLEMCEFMGWRSYIPERRRRRPWRWTDKPASYQKVVYANRRRLKGERSKQLQRWRSEKVERTFAHICETGGARRCWLRGLTRVTKRYLLQAAACNLARIMWKLFGVGTPRSLQGLLALLRFIHFALTKCYSYVRESLPTVFGHIAASLIVARVAAGATTLTLAQVPVNWHVGDEIVLGGTYAKWNQDEDLHIFGIQGNQVTVSPLAYDHTASNGVPVYLTDVTRNIVLQSQEPAVIGNRGHVILMCADMTNIHYAEFLGLGRTNKSVPINDPQLNRSGRLIAGTGTNPRDRYAVDLWEDISSEPAIIDGSSVVGSPGWGFVNHSSNANFTNDVAYNVNGSSFVAEAGDEIGLFDHDLAIHSLGTGSEDFYDPARVPLQDWGHEGDGFWLQGNGMSVTNNVAIGQAASGFYYFDKPYTLPVQDVPPSGAPLTNFSGNVAIGCDFGAFLRYEVNGGTVNNLTVVDCITGYKQQYCAGVHIQNSHLYGSQYSDYGIVLPVESAQGFVSSNNTISGWMVGIRFSEQYNQTLIGGSFSNNEVNLEIPNAVTTGRSITISAPTFVPSTDPGHFDIYWLQEFDAVYTRTLGAFFVADTVLYNGLQFYAPWQHPTYVPFPVQPPGEPLLPSALIGKTNQQLAALYGLVMGGTLAPSTLLPGVRTNGTAGPPAPVQTPVALVSPAQTAQLAGYSLQYAVGTSTAVTVPTPFNLTPGWNMLTVPFGRATRTFFVFGMSYVPANLVTLASMFTHSYEYYANFIAAAYRRYMGRAPDAAGWSGWIGAMQQGLSDQQLEAQFVGSPEYIAHHGGTSQAWVLSMYQNLLRRNPSTAELNSWVLALSRGLSTVDVAYGFVASRERENLRIQDYYHTYLRRNPRSPEVAAWGTMSSHGYSDENILAAFVGSGEYYLSSSHGGRSDRRWVESVYQDLLHRDPSQNEIAAWLSVLH
jgi:hypothetical protein